MKKIILLTISFLFSQLAFCVAIKVLESNKASLHNFSGGNYNVSNHIITVNSNQFNTNTLTVLSGSLMTTAGTYVVLGGISLPSAMGSMALWAPGTTFPNPSPAKLVDFVQWGADNQAYLSVAIAAGLWSAGTFVNASLPIARSGNYGSSGASEWWSSLSTVNYSFEDFVQIGPIPFDHQLNFEFVQGHAFTSIAIYNLLGKLLIELQIPQDATMLTYQTERLTNGIYLLQLKTANGSVLTKRLNKK